MTNKRKLKIAKMLTSICWMDISKSTCPSVILGYCPLESTINNPPCLEVSPQHWLEWMEQGKKRDKSLQVDENVGNKPPYIVTH